MWKSIFQQFSVNVFHYLILNRMLLYKKSYGAIRRDYIQSLKYETNILILFEVPMSKRLKLRTTKNSVTQVDDILTIIYILKTN